LENGEEGGFAYDQVQVKNVLHRYFLKIDDYEDWGGVILYAGKYSKHNVVKNSMYLIELILI